MMDCICGKSLGEFAAMGVFCFVVMNNDYEASHPTRQYTFLFTHNTQTLLLNQTSNSYGYRSLFWL